MYIILSEILPNDSAERGRESDTKIGKETETWEEEKGSENECKLYKPDHTNGSGYK